MARHWRHLQRQQRLESGRTVSADLSGILTSLSSSDTDPAASVEFQDQLEHLIHKLEPTDRRLVELRLEGYSTVEVSRKLGLDAHLLHVRLSRLRERLRAGGVLTEWL